MEHGIGVIAGGPYNSGILAVGPREGATFNYRAASPEMLDKASRIAAVCERHGVPLKAAALQFILAHPAIASVIPGARSLAEVEENVADGGASHPARAVGGAEGDRPDRRRRADSRPLTPYWPLNCAARQRSAAPSPSFSRISSNFRPTSVRAA